MVKICPFLAKIAIFECFWPSKRRYKISIIFGMETTLVVFFEKIIVYMPGIFWDCQNLTICAQNLAKIDSFEGFWLLTSKHRYESSEFLLWKFMVLFEKIILYMPGKFWYGEFLAMK